MQWDINTGQKIASFEGHTQDVMAISLVSLVVEFLEWHLSLTGGARYTMVSLSAIPGIVRFQIVLISTNSPV